jgi:hypothetical protein
LPYALRITSVKAPVVLYTTDECAPCNAARGHLSARGIPFREESVKTAADVEGFKARGFSENRFPALTVGREKTVGFEAGGYDRMLDAAGYPSTSILPFGYRQPAAAPEAAGQPQNPAGTGTGDGNAGGTLAGAAGTPAGAATGAAAGAAGTAGAAAGGGTASAPAADRGGARVAGADDRRGTAGGPGDRGAGAMPMTRF